MDKWKRNAYAVYAVFSLIVLAMTYQQGAAALGYAVGMLVVGLVIYMLTLWPIFALVRRFTARETRPPAN